MSLDAIHAVRTCTPEARYSSDEIDFGDQLAKLLPDNGSCPFCKIGVRSQHPLPTEHDIFSGRTASLESRYSLG